MKYNPPEHTKLSRKQKKQIKGRKRREKPLPTPAVPPATEVIAEIPAAPAPPVQEGKTVPAQAAPAVAPRLGNIAANRFHILAFFLITASVLLAYSNIYQSPFNLDDAHNVSGNFHVRIDHLSLSALKEAASESPQHWRWLPNISFALNYYFHGLDVWGYHLINVLIHILAAVTLYFLALVTLGLATNRKDFPARETALAATLLWALHPVQTNAVTYIVQRMTSMAALFYLLSLLCYVHGRLQRNTPARSRLLFGLCLLFGCMAVVSKENSIMLPFMIIGYELFFLRERAGGFNAKKAAVTAALAIALAAGAGLAITGGNFSGILAKYSVREFTMAERLLTESRVLFHYLGLLILPLPGRLNLDYDFPISTSLFSPPQTILACIGVLALCCLPVLLFKRRRLAAFALFWFLGNLIIESTFIPLELIFEHRLYLPSAFLFIALAAMLYQARFVQLRFLRPALIIVLICFGAFTWQRNTVWQTDVGLWSDIVKKSPNKGRGYLSLGLAYIKLGQTDWGIAHYRKALMVLTKPTDKYDRAKAYRNLGFAYIMKGEYYEAVNELATALQLQPDDAKTHLNLGIAYKKINQPGKAEYHLQRSRSLNSNMFDAGQQTSGHK